MTSAKPKPRPRPTKADSQTELRALTHPEVRAIVLGIMLAMFLGALDQTIVATALPTIGRHFGNLEDLSWVVTAYLLTGTAVTPLYGKLADIHGRRVVMLTAIVIFVTGSVACALAPTMSALVLSRGFQGLGGGGLMALAQTIIADIVSPRERGRYQGYIGAVFATSSVGGPVLGGFLTEHIDWSLIFWINLPLGLCALGMTSNVLRRVPYQPRKHKLDVIGALLMMAASIALLLALTWGGRRFEWISPQIGGLLFGSAALWGLFSWRLVAVSEPFLPLSVLANPVVRCATLAGACNMGTLVGMTIFVPLYFEVVSASVGKRIGHGADSPDGSYRHVFNHHRPHDDARRPLQTDGISRTFTLDSVARAFGDLADVDANGARAAAVVAGRIGTRNCVPDFHRLHAKRSLTCANGCRHRRGELLPRSVFGAGCRAAWRHRSWWSRRCDRDVGRNASPHGIGARACLRIPLCISCLRADLIFRHGVSHFDGGTTAQGTYGAFASRNRTDSTGDSHSCRVEVAAQKAPYDAGALLRR